MLHYVCDFKATHINAQRSLIWEHMLFEFELEHKPAETTQTIWWWKLKAMLVISIIHLRFIREVFSDALSSLPISGYFCIISAPTETPVWLWKSQAASVIVTCYARASTKAKKKKKLIRPDFGLSYRHLSFSKQPMKTGHSTLLCYI